MARDPYLEGKIYEGKNLTAAQKEYNNVVRRFVKNRKQTFEKHGVKIELPKAPKELDSNAINRINNMRWANRSFVVTNPADGEADLEAWFADLVSDATDYQNDVEVANSISTNIENNKRRCRLAEQYASKISNILVSTYNKWGAKTINRILMTAGRYSDLITLCHTIYSVYNVKEEGRKERSMYFERIVTILNQNIPLSDQQYTTLSELGTVDFDYEEDEY